ncbi:MAG: phosphoribosylanthranilate isomerase [Ilumatobacteraceae bacterium]|jgi:phosphoribosylanthranilate isomerase
MFVKICGITSESDALLATAMGADALGFVFATSSRQVSVQIVQDIVKRLPPEVITIGVFRNEHPTRVIDIVNAARLHGAQLHGSETPSMVREVGEQVKLVFKAVVAGSKEAFAAQDFSADAILLDSQNPGSGVAFDWSLADDLPRGTRVVLSGGLTPDNVESAIGAVRPWGVDVSTGVEESPGRKDAVKVRRFIAAARRAGAENFDDLA